jgi:ribosomal protein L28
MARCWICGKTGQMGREVSHSKRSSPARRLPNVQKQTFVLEGLPLQVSACTRCTRTALKRYRVK